MKLNLHIERLVLDGISLTTDQRHLLQASVTAELTRMFAEGDLSSGLADGYAQSRLTAGSIQLNVGSTPTQLGQQIARSVYGGIGHE